MGSIERQLERKQRNETGNKPGYLIQIEGKLTEKPLPALIMRGGFCISRKSSSDLREIDRSYLNHSDDQIDYAVDASPVPVKMIVQHFCKVSGMIKGEIH